MKSEEYRHSKASHEPKSAEAMDKYLHSRLKEFF